MVSIARSRVSDTAFLEPREGPHGVLAQQLVLVVDVAQHRVALLLPADVAGGDERVAPQPPSVVARNEQPVVLETKLGGVRP